MPAAWVGAGVAALNLLGGLSNKRSSSSEIPGMSDYIAQSLAGQRNSQMFAEAAVNPQSEWFRNLAALFREGEQEAAMRGLRLADFNERRAIGRGERNVIGERHDEARIGALMDSFRKAQISSQAAAHGALLNASRGEASSMGNPNAAFDLLRQYGNAESDRQKAIFGSIGEIANKIPWGSFGGGGTDLSGISGGVNSGTGMFNSGYYGLF